MGSALKGGKGHKSPERLFAERIIENPVLLVAIDTSDMRTERLKFQLGFLNRQNGGDLGFSWIDKDLIVYRRK